MADDSDMKLLVKAVTHEADGVVSITLTDPEGKSVPEWKPGAHLEIVLPSGLIRQYSLCGDPTNTAEYRVAVLREPHGWGGSREIHDNGLVGKVLQVQGPRNRFALVDSPSYLFIAGGIGITPLLPMIRAVAGGGVSPGATWSLSYGGRSGKSMAFVDQLTDIATSYGDASSVRLLPEDETGILDLDAILAGATDDTVIYCCGPGGLITAVEDKCSALDLRDRLHIERFGAAPPTRAEGAGPVVDEGPAFEVELRRSGLTVAVKPSESILACVRRAIPDVPASCEEGYCATCEVKVLSGTPDHRDTILTDAERETSQTMFICVSRSKSPQLVIDL
jgi:ferredoxin-NADP reductase